MSRKFIEIKEKIEYLSILDENGELDKTIEPDISSEMLLKLHRGMVLGRRFDQRLINLQRQGRIGTFPPITGQEASNLGTIAWLQSSDWLVPAFRETAAEIWRGRSLESVLIANNGYSEGAGIDGGSNNFPISVPVGSQMLHAVGLGWGIRYRRKKDVVLTYFGDGATSEGDFHEALNFAAVYQVPVILVCQNNQWAISIPRKKQTRSVTLAQKAIAYGMPGIQVDGNDVLAVYQATGEAVKRAREGRGPTLIECVTYRMMMHTTADDPKRYRSDEEVKFWQKRDPITRFEKYLIQKGVLDSEKIIAVQKEVDDQIQTAVDRAEAAMKSMGDPLSMFEHVYADLPPHLAAQKEAFVRELTAEKGE
ncbi:MAG: pyruvate dehydrogenase (acetyl-transferring) E1 component subunit alpha [Desulfobacteraceae bacterium]|jgi:pyruvate dehydrogenase E1 component alpha subunit